MALSDRSGDDEGRLLGAKRNYRLSVGQASELSVPFRDGLLHIPNVPGVGLEWNEDAVAANHANL